MTRCLTPSITICRARSAPPTLSALLQRARTKVPDGEFHEADLHDLPLPDDCVDLVVCALALVHVPALEPVLAEFVRVLRPAAPS